MKNPRYKKSNLLSQKEREKLILESAEKANLLMTICVLHDCFDFGKKRIQKFADCYVELAKSFEHEQENIQKINNEIWERFGIKVL